MIATLLFYAGLALALSIGALYFRDLGDVTQMALRVKRENMHRFIRNEYRLIGAGLSGGLVMSVAHLGFGAGSGWL